MFVFGIFRVIISVVVVVVVVVVQLCYNYGVFFHTNWGISLILSVVVVVVVVLL